MSKAVMTKAVTDPQAVEIVEPRDLFERAKEIYDRIEKRAYELFEDRGFAHGHDFEDWLSAERELLPPVPVELVQHDDKITVKAEVPGFNEDQLKVSVDDKHLMISGKKEASTERKAEEGVYTERVFNEIFRSLDLPSEVDASKISVTLKDGILNITLPKPGSAVAA